MYNKGIIIFDRNESLLLCFMFIFYVYRKKIVYVLCSFFVIMFRYIEKRFFLWCSKKKCKEEEKGKSIVNDKYIHTYITYIHTSHTSHTQKSKQTQK